MRASIYVLLFGIIAGLVGWINQGHLKELARWYWVVRPYKVANIDPLRARGGRRAGTQIQGSLQRMRKGMSRDYRRSRGKFHDGIAADLEGALRQ